MSWWKMRRVDGMFAVDFSCNLVRKKVTYLSDAPKKTFVPDTVKVVLSYAKCHTEAEAWTLASTNAQALTKHWLQMQAQVNFLDVRPPTRVAGAPDMLQVIVFLPSRAWIQVLRASGTDGVFVRPFFENDQDKNLYRVVPMPSSSSLAASIRQSQFFGETAFGVMPYANGYGIRVKSEDFENVLLQIHPKDADQFLGKKLEISGLPLAMGKESLQSFFRKLASSTFVHISSRLSKNIDNPVNAGANREICRARFRGCCHQRSNAGPTATQYGAISGTSSGSHGFTRSASREADARTQIVGERRRWRFRRSESRCDQAGCRRRSGSCCCGRKSPGGVDAGAGCQHICSAAASIGSANSANCTKF